LKEIVNADEKELMKIDLVGKIKAKRLFELFNTKY
jgi:ERCC4-type nuclease